MRSLTICEGPDGGGKTTAIQSLLHSKEVNQREYDVVPFGVPATRDTFSEYTKWLNVCRRVEGGNVVHDRSFVGERVYAPIYRPDARGLSDGDFVHLVMQAAYLGAWFHFFIPPVETLRERYAARVSAGKASPLDEEANERVEVIQQAWRKTVEQMEKLYTFVTVHDTSRRSAENLAFEIARRVTVCRLDNHAFLNGIDFCDGVGSVCTKHTKVVIVGDRMHDWSRAPQPKQRAWQEDPWKERLAFDHGSEGLLFREAFALAMLDDDVKLKANNVYVTYAKKDYLPFEDSIVKLRSELRYLKAPKILCLGKQAYERVQKVGGEFGFGQTYRPEIVLLPAAGAWSRMSNHVPSAYKGYADILKGHLTSESDYS